jgi:hypothetical protein
MRIDAMPRIVTAPRRAARASAWALAAVVTAAAAPNALASTGIAAAARGGERSGPGAPRNRPHHSRGGGQLRTGKRNPAANIARFDANGWSAFGDGFDAPVRALVILDGDLVAGGDFTHSGSVEVNHIARWNGAGWEPLGSGTNASVHALLVQANVILYAGGEFTSAGGVAAHSIAQWIVSWNPVGLGLDGVVHALTLFNGSLIAGGEFTMRDPGSPGRTWRGSAAANGVRRRSVSMGRSMRWRSTTARSSWRGTSPPRTP